MTQKKPCKHPRENFWLDDFGEDRAKCTYCKKRWSRETVRRALLAYDKKKARKK
jgi:hypothetical protein